MNSFSNAVSIEYSLSGAGQNIFMLMLAIVFIASLIGVVRFLKRLHATQSGLVDEIDSWLPQTQCGRCGFEGCRPYAQAIAAGEAVNKCPPGGQELINTLSDLLCEHPGPLDTRHGSFVPAQVAVIREAECIGCTKCIRACPVDAILGGPKLMHTVISDECTGCDLCLQPCPVDCIDLVSVEQQTGKNILPITSGTTGAPAHVA